MITEITAAPMLAVFGMRRRMTARISKNATMNNRSLLTPKISKRRLHPSGSINFGIADASIPKPNAIVKNHTSVLFAFCNVNIWEFRLLTCWFQILTGKRGNLARLNSCAYPEDVV